MYNTIWSNLVYTSKSFIKKNAMVYKTARKSDDRQPAFVKPHLSLGNWFVDKTDFITIYGNILWCLKVSSFLEDRGYMPEIPNSSNSRCDVI